MLTPSPSNTVAPAQPLVASPAAQPPDESRRSSPSEGGPNLGSVMSAALQSLRAKNSIATDLVAARGQIHTLTTERDQARSEAAAAERSRAEASAKADSLEAQLATFAAFFGLEVPALAGQPAAAVSALLTAKVNALVSDQVATLGFPSDKLPAPGAAAAAATKQLTYAEFSALTPVAKMDFSVAGGRITDGSPN